MSRLSVGRRKKSRHTFRRRAIPGIDQLAYVDSCITIYHVERRNPWHEGIAAAFASESPELLCISDLVRMECRVGTLQVGGTALLGRYERLFADMTVLPMTPSVFDRVAELRGRHRIKTPDALHLAAALEHRCDEFWTNDDRLASVATEITVRTFK